MSSVFGFLRGNIKKVASFTGVSTTVKTIADLTWDTQSVE